jgi:hypothetical protein
MSAVAAVSAEPKGARALPAEQWQLSTFKDLFSCKRCPLSLGRSVILGPCGCGRAPRTPLTAGSCGRTRVGPKLDPHPWRPTASSGWAQFPSLPAATQPDRPPASGVRRLQRYCRPIT